MYQDTQRVLLWGIQPSDLLFYDYDYDGDEHVAACIGHVDMIEASETGQVVHITPIHLGYDSAGLARPRA